MTYYINPSDYNLNEEGILIVYDRVHKSVVAKLKIRPNQVLQINDDNIIENISNHNYVLKIRTNEGKDSSEITGYFYLIKKDILTNYWLDKISLNEYDIINYIYYFGRNDKIMELKNSFNASFNNILINLYGNHSNLKQFLNISKRLDLPIIFKNINTYLHYLGGFYNELSHP